MASATGSVLRIERTSMHDGEGLRTVFFLKGCPLRCLWCSTPESQSAVPEKEHVRDKCNLCGSCAEVCPGGALSLDCEAGGVFTDRERCNGCLACVERCPHGALKGYGLLMTADRAVREIARDEVFYFHSGGGVTISGGEPLEQAAFVREILAGCRDRGIHRAMETSFFAAWERIESLLPYLNLVYVDLKHIDPETHRRIVGVDSGPILENMRRASDSPYDFEMIVRMPMVPGVNDEDAAIEGAARFVKGLSRVGTVEFLAYHRLGTETYRNLGLAYPLPEIAVPDRVYMEAKARRFREIAGVRVLINGVSL